MKLSCYNVISYTHVVNLCTIQGQKWWEHYGISGVSPTPHLSVDPSHSGINPTINPTLRHGQGRKILRSYYWWIFKRIHHVVINEWTEFKHHWCTGIFSSDGNSFQKYVFHNITYFPPLLVYQFHIFRIRILSVISINHDNIVV